MKLMYSTISAMKAFIRKLFLIYFFAALLDLSESVDIALETRLEGQEVDERDCEEKRRTTVALGYDSSI